MTLLTRPRARRLVLLATSLTLVGCAVPMAPPPAPAARMPRLSHAPPEPGEGMARVFFDTDTPAKVEQVTGQGRRHTEWALLCERTPCAVTLPYGDHEVRFTGLAAREDRSSAIVVHVRRATEVVNHTLGERRAGVGSALGAGLAVVGGISLGVAIGLARGRASADTLEVARGAALFGLGSLGVGAFFAIGDPVRYHEGATTQWSPPPARAAGASVGVRF